MAGLLYDKSLEEAVRVLDWCVRRHRAISSNIVNRDTPGYKAVDIDFERVMEEVREKPGEGLVRTNPSHLSLLPGSPFSVYTVKESSERLDGNTVNLPEEMSHLVENNYLYQALLREVAHKFKTLKIAIQGG